MNKEELNLENFQIDAIELSRRLRIETGKELSVLSREERCKILNSHTENDPILSRFPRFSGDVPTQKK